MNDEGKSNGSYNDLLHQIEHKLHPTSVSVQKLKEKGYNVGYQNSSFVLDFLKNQLKFDESKLKPYDTVADYHKALSKGSEHNGVAAIFDGIPYIRLFLAKHGSEYMMTGPMYRTDGFGFQHKVTLQEPGINVPFKGSFTW
ncbi:hypothetical protein QQP08_025321 [Theobroma cacao]|nr:hypothetical protein QQP08_025321 [Theobroma cacao]